MFKVDFYGSDGEVVTTASMENLDSKIVFSGKLGERIKNDIERHGIIGLKNGQLQPLGLSDGIDLLVNLFRGYTGSYIRASLPYDSEEKEDVNSD